MDVRSRQSQRDLAFKWFHRYKGAGLRPERYSELVKTCFGRGCRGKSVQETFALYGSNEIKMTRLKVLISAYAASPYQGSEAGVGWGIICSLAEHHELHVIVEEEKFRADIERFLKLNPARLSNVRFYFIRKKRNRKLRRIWPPSYYWYYRSWQKSTY